MIEVLAWTGFAVLSLGTVYQLFKGAVEISREHDLAGLFIYTVIQMYLIWCCVHLLRFA